ncbi:MAG TPA: hypothetical protein PKO06_23000 [Candidatus Ozemobacteraceae bacterium]|nr:hypothetical protein [Candidatus Ozemobacteraceae bacterium]
MQKNRKQGSAILGLLMGVIMIALLSTMYFSGSGGTSAPQAIQHIDDGKAAACGMIRQTLETQVQLWQVQNPGQKPTIENLTGSTIGTAKCPGNGSYTFGADNRIHCNKHK